MKRVTTFFFLLILSTSCMNETTAQKFSGSFAGNQTGIVSTATFTTEKDQLKGKVVMNGKTGTVTGVVTDTLCMGTIYDEEMHKNYSFSATINNSTLRFAITFPELNNQVIELVMQKEQTQQAKTKSTAGKGDRNKAVVGLWRYTEVLSSGSGGNYMSFSTDYFMEFKEDGTALSWTGNSAGGSSDVSISAAESDKTEKSNWRTDTEKLYFIDPATGKEVHTFYYAEPSRMMLHDGKGTRKVLQRIR
jgi:hypothetical protein